MPEPKWTPGPWRTHDAGSQGVVIMPDCVDKRERSRYIAIVNGRDATVDRANARLIAAAPELYAALQRTLWTQHCKCTDEPEEGCWCFAARAALAKADGRDA